MSFIRLQMGEIVSRPRAGLLLLIVLLTLLWGSAARAEREAQVSVNDILDKLEARYAGRSVAVRFEQRSFLKVMNITDTASGRGFFKPPGMMRWEYEQPEPQQIITDGTRLWIYKPDENQVVVGKAPSLFGEDSGVNLFARIDSIRKLFEVFPVPERDKSGYHVLRLVPVEKISDISKVYITISAPDHNLVEIETINRYGDTTRIAFTKIHITEALDSDLFTFDIPVDADVIHLDNQQ